MINLEILKLSECDPTMDVVIVYVDIGKSPPTAANKLVEQVQHQLTPMFRERGFDVLFVARRSNLDDTTIEIMDKHNKIVTKLLNEGSERNDDNTATKDAIQAVVDADN